MSNYDLALIEGAKMARNLAHRCRRAGDLSEFHRHMQRARYYIGSIQGRQIRGCLS